MGSFPHELPGYRHISEGHTVEMFESLWGRPLDKEPGLRIPNMIDAALDGSFKGSTSREDILQSDPNTQHMAAGLAAMECAVVQTSLFLVETANYALPACSSLPGSTFSRRTAPSPMPNAAFSWSAR